MTKTIISGIYIIENSITGIIYIGQAVNFKQRKKDHFKTLKNGTHSNPHLQNSYNKYGRDAFSFYIIEYVEDLESLTKREQSWLDLYRYGAWCLTYNIEEIAASSLGVKRSRETRQKISKSKTGTKLTIEHRQSISKSMMGKKNHFYGKNHSDETLEHLSKINSGVNHPRYAQRGILHSQLLGVHQIDKITKEIIKTWGSIRDAERNTGIDHGSISKVCKGKLKSAGGFGWQYAD